MCLNTCLNKTVILPTFPIWIMFTPNPPPPPILDFYSLLPCRRIPKRGTMPLFVIRKRCQHFIFREHQITYWSPCKRLVRHYLQMIIVRSAMLVFFKPKPRSFCNPVFFLSLNKVSLLWIRCVWAGKRQKHAGQEHKKKGRIIMSEYLALRPDHCVRCI